MKKLTIAEAIPLLIAGEAIAIPTETVYGLAADATSDLAVQKIFEAKGRPSDNPLIVHIGHFDQIQDLILDVPNKAQILMDLFWPGPLTVIMPCSNKVSSLVTAGLDSVGLRMPSHPVALELLQTSRIPLAAPSANVSGRPSPTCADHVIHDMTGRIPGVIDGGVCDVGLESTVIDMTTEMPTILRPGVISRSQIEAAIGPVAISDGSSDRPKSPGMKYAHYAPDAEVILVQGDVDFLKSQLDYYNHLDIRVGVLCLDSHKAYYDFAAVVHGIGNQGSNLYAALRDFDAKGIDLVLCECFDDDAVMNRLMKASEGRVLEKV